MSLILFAVLSTPFSNPVLLSHPLKLPIKRANAIKENTNRYLRILTSFIYAVFLGSIPTAVSYAH
jgi:uncharacterized membrane-anchored protein YjiN (DUF445 family)